MAQFLALKQSKLKQLAACLVACLVAVSGLSACSGPGTNGAPLELDGRSNQLFQPENIDDLGLAQAKRIALTFDDGPTPGVTEALLDLLKSENVRATFFVLGKQIAGREHLLERMRREGHLIANHTWSHRSLRSASPAEAVEEVAKTHRELKKYLRPGDSLFFRAPHGAWSAEHARVLNADPELRSYIGPIFWNAGGDLSPSKVPTGGLSEENIESAADWKCWREVRISPKVCATGYFRELQARGGGIALLHDNDYRTVRLTKILIHWLRQSGFSFVTLNEAPSTPSLR